MAQSAPKPAWLQSLAFALALFALFYFTLNADSDPTLLNQAYALHAASLLALSFIAGALARAWPRGFDLLGAYRMPLIAYGFLASAGHMYTVLIPLDAALSNPAHVAGWVALAIFLGLCVQTVKNGVSGNASRVLDAAGIAAMSLVLVHFAGSQIREGTLEPSRPEWLVLALVALGILGGAACLVLERGKKPASIQERRKSKK